ncbi:putative L-type lectin-domain containing receptor kinase S.7 [Bienertia sinuspersici]
MACTTSLRKFLTWLTLMLVSYMVLGVENGANKKHTITISKSISFPQFSTSINPRLEHDVKLLGSAKLSNDSQSIQIPDISEADDLRHQAGRAIYSSPIRVLDPISQTPASFETIFTFRFNNHNTSSSGYHSTSEEAHGGSGLTFLIAPDEFTVGRAGPWLGMLNDACSKNYKFIAVEFDTRQNPEFGDPNDNHIGINLGSIVSKSIVNASDYGLSFEDGSTHLAQITYDGYTKRMQIRVGSFPSFTLRSVFTDDIDLTPFLNEYMKQSTNPQHFVLELYFRNPWSLRYPTSEACEAKILVGKYRVNQRKGMHVKEKKPSTTFMIFVCVVLLCSLIVINFYCNGKRPNKSNAGSAFLDLPEKKYRPTPPNKPRRYTGAELSLATREEIPKRVGSVSRVRHPGLVPIRGWSYDTREYMVVYEYMFNGCVDKWLFGVGVLPWSRRFKVVKNVANGLTYLHSRDLAHNNVQVSSIFLDVTFKALLGDFGLSDPFGIDTMSSRSVDVFYFGILVLEVVSGRKRWVTKKDSRQSIPSDSERAMDEMDLVDYAWIMHEKNEKFKMVDRRMGSGLILHKLYEWWRLHCSVPCLRIMEGLKWRK